MKLVLHFSRDRKGRIVKDAEYQSKVKSGEVARVEPNRKWFGNLCSFFFLFFLFIFWPSKVMVSKLISDNQSSGVYNAALYTNLQVVYQNITLEKLKVQHGQIVLLGIYFSYVINFLSVLHYTNEVAPGFSSINSP